ncbi:hypothetical protein BH11PLA1_BH11PLA1_21710 [soil metagenome]
MPSAAHTLTLGACTYNRGPELLDTLRAIAALRRPVDAAGAPLVLELLVIDNNSTDGTAALVDGFAGAQAAGDLPVRRVVETRQGLAQARRRLFTEARGDLVAFLDDDVIPDAAWAEATLAAFERHPNAGAVGGRVRLAFRTGPTALAHRFRSFLAEQELGAGELLITDPTKALVGAALCLRRDAVVKSGWLERQSMADRQGETLSSGGDNELCVRIRRAGFETWYAPGALVDHIIPAQRQTGDYLARLAAGIGVSIPQVKLIAREAPTVDWARENLRRAQTRRARTLLLEWRRALRPIRMAEHEGRVEGWSRVLRELELRAPSAAADA